ncbi:MAG: 2,5-diamino-6-(ribosylamino)-4(3H)-pyrimidinone 5'-phosphate reductase [Desulfurococcales archaeon]|nr:2,5-diamino-6-(ribosylamino)-4(3H)-pyrimidinone 5'-phosphate reductase [Desulfurococcales archaeon]
MDIRRLPRVTVFSTMTVDGKIASKTGYSKLSCRYDLERLHRLRSMNDAVMVGANTILVDNPRLTVRYVEGPNPARIVVDALLKTPATANVYRQPPKTYLVTFRENVDYAREKYQGVEIIGVPYRYDDILDLEKALIDLYGRGIRSVLVEGGGYLNWTLFKLGLVDEVRVTVSPYIFGGNKVCFVSGEGFDGFVERVELKLREIERCRCGNEVHLVYDVVKKERER